MKPAPVGEWRLLAALGLTCFTCMSFDKTNVLLDAFLVDKKCMSPDSTTNTEECPTDGDAQMCGYLLADLTLLVGSTYIAAKVGAMIHLYSMRISL